MKKIIALKFLLLVQCTVALLSCSELPQQRLFLLIGLPGSGKTTVSQKIAQKYPDKIVHLSAGDLLRAEALKNTDRAKVIGGLISSGKLVPFETTLEILGDFLTHNTKPIIIIDGYQGTKDYIAPFHQLLNRHQVTFAKTLSFDVEISTALERCRSRMRVDDNPQALQNRLESRLHNISDIQEWYKQANWLSHIDGNDPLEIVTACVEKIIMTP